MKNLDEKMEKITGKRTERQRQEIIENRRELKEAREIEENNRSFAMDLLQEFKSLNKRLFIVIVVILSLWFLTIAGFVLYLNQYDFSSETITVDGKDGTALYQDGQGNVINNGENSSKKNDENEKERQQ